MSVAAVMLVKDEVDIIGHTLRRLRDQLDHVYVSDDNSTDGTREILRELEREGDWLDVFDCEDPAYYQSRKTTALAMRALDDGHQWVVPIDADEFWYANDGRTIAQLIGGLAPDVQFVSAPLFHHLPTAIDSSEAEEPNPFRRIGWRKREHGVLGKVACRLRPDLVIHAGNHGASTDGTGLSSSGLTVRHFSWRSAEQYLKKIRNGESAYKLTTGLPADTGAHWRGWEGRPDEAILDSFRYDFWSAEPRLDGTLLYDPAPGA